MFADPWFLSVAIPAVLLTGISKGGFAGGLGLLAVPLMSLVVSPVQAAAIFLPVLLVMDAVGLIIYRRKFDLANIKQLFPGAVLGIGIGTLTFGYVNEAAVRLIVGVIAVAFGGYALWPRAQMAKPSARQRRYLGPFWGTIAGFTSFIAHAGAPPFQVHVIPQRLDKTIYVGTSIIFFALINLVKLPPYYLLGQLAPANLMMAAILIPFAPLGMAMGYALHKRIPERPFFLACYVFILIVGMKLIYDGVVGLV